MSEWFTHPEPDVHMAGDDKGRSYTPDQCAHAVLVSMGSRMRPPSTMLEPCVGGGAFVRAARKVWGTGLCIVGTDTDPAAPGLKLCTAGVVKDARQAHPPDFDLVITNPPFGKAVGQETTVAIMEAGRRATHPGHGVWAMVVPLDYLAQAGLEHLVRSCTHVRPLLPRPFTQERGMVLLVKDNARSGPCIHEPLRWKA